MTCESFYETIEESSLDPIAIIAEKYIKDTNPNKVDLSIGVYKPESGDIKYVFPSVKQAKKIIYENDEGHSYHKMSGLPELVLGAQKVIFGEEHVNDGKFASIQTISGTGAINIAIKFLKQLGLNNYYIGKPTWGNYQAMIEAEGGQVNYFSHYDFNTGEVDFPAVLEAIDSMPNNSVLLLQACCHNPTGADYSKDQWKQLADKVKSKNIYTFFDIAYQGFASGNKDEDAWPIRYFYEQQLPFLVTESFSKNMGIYGERVGCIHVVSNNKQEIPRIHNLLTNIFRTSCSFAPLFGARIGANLIHNLKSQWDQDVLEVYERMKSVREKMFTKLTKLNTPGNWDSILKQNGLFWYSGLTEQQSNKLCQDHHIYLAGTRVNIAGINESNMDYIAGAIDQVVRQN